MAQATEWPQEITNEELTTGTYVITPDEGWSDLGRYLYRREDYDQLVAAAAETWEVGEEEIANSIESNLNTVYVRVEKVVNGVKLFAMLEPGVAHGDTLFYIDDEDHTICVWDGIVEVVNRSGHRLDYEAAVVYMDDEIRERLHDELAPCSEQEFFSAYEKAHEEKYGEEWELSKENPVW